MNLFWALVGQHVQRERWRALATVLAVAFGVALVLAIDLANDSAVASFTASVNVVAEHVNLQVLGSGPGFSETAYQRLAQAPQVQAAAPVIEGELQIGAVPGDPLSGDVLHVLGIDVVQQAVAANLDQLINEHGVVLGAELAQRYHLRTGQLLHALAGAQRVALPVVAILPRALPGVDSSVVFMDIATAQEIFQRVGFLDRIDLTVDPAQRESVARVLTRFLPAGARLITPQSRLGEIRRILASFQMNLAALSYVALLVGVFLMYNTIAISVVQRRGDIGLLRGLGATRRQIWACFLGEGLIFGFWGALVGLALGAYLARYAVAAVTKTVASMYVATHSDGVVYSWWPFVKAFVFGVIAASLAALQPAQEAAATPPALTMRTRSAELRSPGLSRRAAVLGAAVLVVAGVCTRVPALGGVPVFGYVAGVALIFGVAALIPAGIRVTALSLRVLGRRLGPTTLLAATNLAAAQRRNAVAVAGLMTAVGMMVAIAVLVGSFRTTVVAWAHDTLRADLYVRPPGAADASFAARLDEGLVARLGRVPGIAALDTFRAMSLPFHGGLTTLAGVDIRTVLAYQQLRFLDRPKLGDLQDALLTGRGALVSEPFATRFGLGVGDLVPVPSFTGVHTLRIMAIYNDYSSDAGVVLIERSQYQQWFHDTSENSLAIYAKPGVDLFVLRSRILQAAAPAQIEIQSSRELRTYVLTIFNRTFTITYALYVISIAIAIVGVISTFLALVLERRLDIAILRYLGLTKFGVGKMICIEAGAIGFLGGSYGIALGLGLAALLMYVINRQAFGWLITLQMPWLFLFEAFVLVIAAAVVSSIWPARIAASLPATGVTDDE